MPLTPSLRHTCGPPWCPHCHVAQALGLVHEDRNCARHGSGLCLYWLECCLARTCPWPGGPLYVSLVNRSCSCSSRSVVGRFPKMHSSKRPHTACQMHVQGFLGQGSSPSATLGPRCCIRTVSEGSQLAVWNLTGCYDSAACGPKDCGTADCAREPAPEYCIHALHAHGMKVIASCGRACGSR